MYKKKTKTSLAALFLCMLFLSGCGKKQEVTPPTDIFIQESFENTLKTEELISFDKMSDFSFTETEANESDMESLKSKFPSRVEFKKYEATFTLVSVAVDIKANYSAIFVFNDGEWKISFGYPTNSSEWEYTGKQTVNIQRMMDDLKETNFDSFSVGYVGDTKYSSLKITKRNTDMSVNRDDISLLVNVRTDFAEYDIPVDMVYYFNKGEWVLGDVSIQDSSEWKLAYSNGRAPTFMTDNEIMAYLTVDTNFLTYTSNLNFVDDYSIEKVSEKATKESVIAEYEFRTRYDYIGTIVYTASADYEWLDGEWGEPTISVASKEADFTEMLKYEWKNESGNSFIFQEISYEDSTGMYQIAGSYNNIPVVLHISVMLRDNNWDGKLLDEEGNEIFDLPASAVSMNLEYSALLFNNMLFSPTEIQIAEEPQPTEEPQPVNTSNDLNIEGIAEETTFDNIISKNGLSLSNISVIPDLENGILTIKGKIDNGSGAMSGYRISAAVYDKNDGLLSEGLLKGEAQLTDGSSAMFSFETDAIDLEGATKLTIYVRN